VARAVDGDKAALEEVIRLLSPIRLYRLALRDGVAFPGPDAETRPREILIRVVTRLASWRSEAKLLNLGVPDRRQLPAQLRRKTPQEAQQLSLEEFGGALAAAWPSADYRGPEATVLAQEVRLSAPRRCCSAWSAASGFAFVLSDIFELSSADAAWILDTTPAAYRKRLERARHRIGAVHELHLRRGQPGRVLAAAPAGGCRRALATGRVDPRRPAFTAHPVSPSGRGVAEAARPN